MTRNLKILMLAAMAVAALSAVGASSAQAAEFHCSVEPCRITVTQDGTGKTAHQVFDVNLPKQILPITCKGVHAEATMTKKTEASLTIENIQYTECEFVGRPATVSMNGCDFLFTAAGQVQVKCPEGKQITFEAEGCVVHVPAQGPLNGITYHNLPEGGGKVEVTTSAAVKGIQAVATGAGCPEVGESKTGEYTTGNTIATGEQDNAAKVMEEFWVA